MKHVTLDIVKLLSTADVMKASGVGRETLRYYEEKGLIKPVSRTAAGYRQFIPAVVQRIGFIKQTQQAGFSLQEIQELLQLRATAENTCGNVGDLLEKKRRLIDDEIAAWQRKRAVIETMIGDCCKVNDCRP